MIHKGDNEKVEKALSRSKRSVPNNDNNNNEKRQERRLIMMAPKTNCFNRKKLWCQQMPPEIKETSPRFWYVFEYHCVYIIIVYGWHYSSIVVMNVMKVIDNKYKLEWRSN